MVCSNDSGAMKQWGQVMAGCRLSQERCGQVALTRAHLVDLPSYKLPESNTGMRTGKGGVGVVWGGWGGEPVSQEMLFCPHVKSPVEGEKLRGLWEDSLSGGER